MTQNKLHTAPSLGIPEIGTQKSTLSIGFIMLVVFGFFRPLSLTMGFLTVFGLSPFTIFGAAISYLLLIPVLLCFRNLPLDRTVLLSILFCLYCAGSVLWGSDATIIARVTLPFIVFFAARIFITEPKQIGIILIALVIGYLVPIAKSTFDIAFGRSIEMVSYWSGIERFGGAYGGSHGLAYAMLFFSIICCLLNRTRQLSGKLSRSGLFVFQLLAIFCLYKSYTRTAIAGFIIFWSIYFWGTNKKRFFLAIMACGLVAIVASQRIENIFWQSGLRQPIERDALDMASSGRLMIWRHNVQLFLDSTLPQQLIGRGLGRESKTVIGSDTDVWSSHNDYLALVMALGIIGLFLYLSLLSIVFWDIYTCGLDKSAKYLFVGIIFSVSAMNFLSNATVFRPELSQYFWLFMGFFYFAKERAGAYKPSSSELDQSYFPI